MIFLRKLSLKAAASKKLRTDYGLSGALLPGVFKPVSGLPAIGAETAPEEAGGTGGGGGDVFPVLGV